MSDGAVQPHHEAASAMWSVGGEGYDAVSFMISDALAHASQRLNAQAGERVLDVATGTGWSARNAARSGAHVTAIDIAPGLLEAAKSLSDHVSPAIDFRLGDAEALPFDDASFDRVISTFGAIFASDQAQTAAELARVLKPGGRLVMLAWDPEGMAPDFFKALEPYQPAPDGPPPETNPMQWGDPDHVRGLLGDAFDLAFEHGVNVSYHDSVEEIVALYAQGFGPVRQLAESLPPDRRDAMFADLRDNHRKYEAEMGLRVERAYQLIRGTRR